MFLFLLLGIYGCSGKVEGDKLEGEITQYLLNASNSPVEYILNNFKNHDIVILGEFGKIKSDVEFVKRLVPQLFANGIEILGIEYARRIDQPLIDSLLTGEEYDSSLARQILFNFNVFWGYDEYADIFEAAWKINKEAGGKDSVFRIIGLNDAPQWNMIKYRKYMDLTAMMGKVMRGQGQHLWAEKVLKETVRKGEKALIYCNYRNGFTRFLPVGADTLESNKCMGNYIYDEIGQRVFMVMLNPPLPASGGYSDFLVLPAGGVIERCATLIDTVGIGVGFDVLGSPLGRVRLKGDIYSENQSGIGLGDICDGWIYLGPLSESSGVTTIEDFVNENNLEIARNNAPNPAYRNASAEKFMEAIASEADFSRRLKYIRK